VEVDAFAVADVIFHARAHAAGPGVAQRLVLLVVAGLEREIVNDAAVGVLRGADVVEQGALEEIRHAGVGVPAEDVPGELEHVVHVAGLGGGRAEAVVEAVGRAEVLVVAMPAGDVGVVVHHALPEERGGGAVGRVAGQLITGGQADEFGDLGVGVFAGQDVLAAGQGFEDGAMVNAARQREVTGVAGVGVKVGKGLVQTAVLAGEHLLHLLVREVGVGALEPVGQAAGHGQRLCVAGQPVGIAQAGEEFVQGVVRHPDAVEVEAGRTDVAGGDFGIGPPPAGDGGHVAVAVGGLAFGQLGHQVVHAAKKFLVARGGPGQGAGAQVMAGRVPGNAHPLPAAVMLGLRRQPRFLTKAGQKPVRLQAQQIRHGDVLAGLERTAG
jgi:hypothetical protein